MTELNAIVLSVVFAAIFFYILHSVIFSAVRRATDENTGPCGRKNVLPRRVSRST